MDKKKVILADDHDVVIKGLVDLIGDKHDIIATCGNAQEVTNFLKEGNVDVLITDISMPGSEGLDYMKEFSKLYPNLNILVFSMHSDVEYVKKALELGAKGYVLKDTKSDVLLNGIDEVANGNNFFCSKATLLLAQGLKSNLNKKNYQSLLTKREREILKHIVSGLSAKMIADKLFLSERTVSSHRYNIMQKLDAKNSADLVRMAFENNLI